MKRGGPIKRRTPLPRRSSTLAPKTPIGRGRHQRKPSKTKDMKSENALFWSEQRRRLWLRSGGRCEVGGCDLNQTGLEAHHRKLRSQGGEHPIENLLAVCPRHHTHGPGSIHGSPAWAREHGYIVPGHGDYDPATWAVILYDGRTVRLTTDGGYDVVFPTPAGDHE